MAIKCPECGSELNLLNLLDDSYQTPYRLRKAQSGVRTLEVTFPYDVVEREARRNGIPVEEFIKQFQVVARRRDDLGGVFYTFERIV